MAKKRTTKTGTKPPTAAKRRTAKPATSVVVKYIEDVVEIEDGGIYPHKTKTGEKTGEFTPDEFKAAMQAAGDWDGHLRALLERARLRAVAIVQPVAQLIGHGIPSGRYAVAMNFGDGMKTYAVPKSPDDAVREGVELLRLVESFSRHPSSNAYDALELIKLGRLMEVLQVRPYEPRVKHAKGTERGQPKATAQKKTNAAMKLQTLLSQYDKLVREKPGIKKTPILDELEPKWIGKLSRNRIGTLLRQHRPKK